MTRKYIKYTVAYCGDSLELRIFVTSYRKTPKRETKSYLRFSPRNKADKVEKKRS